MNTHAVHYSLASSLARSLLSYIHTQTCASPLCIRSDIVTSVSTDHCAAKLTTRTATSSEGPERADDGHHGWSIIPECFPFVAYVSRRRRAFVCIHVNLLYRYMRGDWSETWKTRQIGLIYVVFVPNAHVCWSRYLRAYNLDSDSDYRRPQSHPPTLSRCGCQRMSRPMECY